MPTLETTPAFNFVLTVSMLILRPWAARLNALQHPINTPIVSPIHVRAVVPTSNFPINLVHLSTAVVFVPAPMATFQVQLPWAVLLNVPTAILDRSTTILAWLPVLRRNLPMLSITYVRVSALVWIACLVNLLQENVWPIARHKVKISSMLTHPLGYVRSSAREVSMLIQIL